MAKGIQAFTDRARIAFNVGAASRRYDRARETVEVGVYSVWYQYGGPEEGGWGGDCGQLLASRRCRPARVEHVTRKLLEVYGFDADYPRTSVLGGDEIGVHVSKPGRRYYRQRLGHYE